MVVLEQEAGVEEVKNKKQETETASLTCLMSQKIGNENAAVWS